MIRRKDGRTFWTFDCHFHMGESGLLKRFRGMEGGFLGDRVIRHVDKFGLDLVCGFPTADKTDYSENTYKILATAKDNPDRVIPFTRINPHYQDTAASSIAGLVEKGVKGIKFHPLWDGYPANDPTLMRPVIEEANRFGLTVIFHSGETWMSLPGLIFDLAMDYKNVKFIIGHSGLYGFDTEAMVMAKRADNIWLDTTELYPSRRIRTIANTVGVDRIVFGTDSPYINAAAEIEKVLRFSELNDDELDKVFGMNLAGVMGITPDLSKYEGNVVDYPIDDPTD